MFAIDRDRSESAIEARAYSTNVRIPKSPIHRTPQDITAPSCTELPHKYDDVKTTIT